MQLLLEGILPAHLHPMIGKAIHAATRFIPVALRFPLTILSLALAQTWRGYLGRRFAMVGNLTYSSCLLHFPLQLLVFELTRYMGIANTFFYSSLSMVLSLRCSFQYASSAITTSKHLPRSMSAPSC